ncbi:MAG: type III secretion inner membrane ring lipoprotein SctJ [Pseudomonadota bacterium]
MRSLFVKISVLVAAAMLLAACNVDLYSDLDEREANEMLAVLGEHGIAAERVADKDGKSSLKVPKDQLAIAVTLLKERGYPKQKFSSIVDVFKGDNFIQSPVEVRARYIYALGEELSQTISQIDGVLSARVHVVLPKNDPLRNSSTPSSAAVFIRHDSEFNVRSLVSQIKLLVANGIDDLSYEKVSVVFLPVILREPLFNAPTLVDGDGKQQRNWVEPQKTSFLQSSKALAVGATKSANAQFAQGPMQSGTMVVVLALLLAVAVVVGLIMGLLMLRLKGARPRRRAAFEREGGF